MADFDLNRIALAALAGLMASVALVFSPLLGSLPPIFIPYVPIDLRFAVLPVVFAGVQAMTERVKWPAKATTTLGMSVFAAVPANFHASAALAYVGVGWARPGTSIDVLPFVFSLGAVAIGLWIAFDAGRQRFLDELRDRGIVKDEVDRLDRHARRLSREGLAVPLVGVAVLALIVRVYGFAAAGQALPLAELAAILVALGAGVVMLGVPGRLAEGLD